MCVVCYFKNGNCTPFLWWQVLLLAVQNCHYYMRSPKPIGKFFTLLTGILLSFSAYSQKTLSTTSDFPELKDAFELFNKGNFQAASENFRKYSASEAGDLRQTAQFYSAHCARLLHRPDAEQKLIDFNQTFPGRHRRLVSKL